jgi:hypothetical protein
MDRRLFVVTHIRAGQALLHDTGWSYAGIHAHWGYTVDGKTTISSKMRRQLTVTPSVTIPQWSNLRRRRTDIKTRCQLNPFSPKSELRVSIATRKIAGLDGVSLQHRFRGRILVADEARTTLLGRQVRCDHIGWSQSDRLPLEPSL